MKTSYKYHALMALVFFSIGWYLLLQSSNTTESLTGDLNAYLPWVIICWGLFKGINAYLVFQKGKKNNG